MRRRGITLLELMMSLAITVMVAVASARAYSIAVGYDARLKTGRDQLTERHQFEDTIINLLHHAWLSSSTTDTNSYFIGEQPQPPANPTTAGAGGTTTAGTAGATTGTSTQSQAGGGGSGSGAYGTPNVMVFTAAGLPISQGLLASTGDDVTNNTNFGPQGGITEVELSQTAVGSQGQSQQGLFLRTQAPSDNDPTQGGYELNMDPNLSQIGFEFFDGTQWDQSWNTQSQTAPGRLPAAVRVTYRLKGDTTDNVFIVRLPASDVTYLNPVTVTG